MTLPRNMRAVRLEAYHEELTDAIRSLGVVEQPLPSRVAGKCW